MDLMTPSAWLCYDAIVPMADGTWHDVGSADEFRRRAVSPVEVGALRLAITCVGGELAAISGTCGHVGGPLGYGRLDGEYVVCPWHGWRYHWRTGRARPQFAPAAVATYAVREERGRLLVNLDPATRGAAAAHPKHPLDREPVREPGPLRVAGIATTVMDRANPRYSTSTALLDVALEHAAARGLETRRIDLASLSFRACEGYYSKSARACTWPCSITQMDSRDELDRVYEALVFWADVVLVATPIRWGSASALYYKLAERLNCVQNQVTTHDRVLIRRKVAGFVITGGQDNVQAVAGQLLTFFSELGYLFPQFPFVGHSRGWEAEDMEQNVAYVRASEPLRASVRELVDRCAATAALLLAHGETAERTARSGRKAGGTATTQPA
jgi:nitrite reductase/ring-hydroxylating ferredoxin subunit/multimeric flavodoxin WrbA